MRAAGITGKRLSPREQDLRSTGDPTRQQAHVPAEPLMVDAILIRHHSLHRVPIQAADIDALRRRWPRIEEIRIEPPARETFAQFDESYPWEAAKQQQAEQYRAVEAARDAHPEAQLLYMGFVAVPLAVHLGSMLGQTARVEIFQHHPQTLSWAWPKNAPTRKLLRPPNEPQADPSSSREVLIRVSCSHKVQPSQTEFLADRCHVYDLALLEPIPTALQSRADLDQLAQAFRQLLDESIAAFPRARVRHLTAAVPVGAALALGMQLSSTKHLPLQTWKFLSHRARPYVKALRVGEYLDRPGALLLGASPINRKGISAAGEIQALVDVLGRSPEQVRVLGRPSAGARELADLLAEVDPTVVHLASHGRAEDGHLPAALTLSTVEGFALEVPLEELIRLLKRAPKLQCVVITACESAPIAERLVEELPCAVGFDGQLHDEDARDFSLGFWESLMRGRSVAEAFKDGRLRLDESRREQAQLFPKNDPALEQLTPIQP
jgi:CHAT domain-containing protein